MGEQNAYYCTDAKLQTTHPVCRKQFVSGLSAKDIVSISKNTGQIPGDLPFELYTAVLDDNTSVAVRQAFHTSCHHIVPVDGTTNSTQIHPAYFDVVKKIFMERNQAA